MTNAQRHNVFPACGNFFWTPTFQAGNIGTGRRFSLLKSQAVAQYLPFLRRYARALTGNQSSGDAYVGATLEALIEDPKVIDETGGPRVALYRLFTKIWSSVGLNARRLARRPTTCRPTRGSPA